MRITKLRLFEFRNYQSLELYPRPDITVLTGSNAQGKTNIVEAVLLCATASSHRTSKDAELIRIGEPAAYIGVDLQKKDGVHRVEIKLHRDGRRGIRLDGEPMKRSGDLIGCLHTVMFSPEDLRLVKEGPSGRRRFLNIGISQLNRGYFLRLVEYMRILRQRNALLKEIALKGCAQSELDVWDIQLSGVGSGLTALRKWYIQNLSPIAAEKHAAIAGGEKLEMSYRPCVEGETVEEMQSAILNKLAQSRKEDIRRQSTQTGPHHDELLLRINGADARSYASQGQQRTAALALKLAELAFLWSCTNEAPVLLLDDVLSELDSRRQERLLEGIDGCQTILTCAGDTGLWTTLPAAVYTVEGGRLRKA